MAEEEKKQYSGYGYHGGGRKATGVKRISICISGQPEQVEKLKELAALERKTVSSFIFEKTGVNKMNEKTWFVANDDGEVIGHDMTEARAKALAEEMRSKKTFCIEYYGTSGNGYVSYDNDCCDSLDMAMTFDSEEDAKSKCEELQKEWKSELRISSVSDESWEALNGDEE